MKYSVGHYDHYRTKDPTVSVIALIILFFLIQGCLFCSTYFPSDTNVAESSTQSTTP